MSPAMFHEYYKKTAKTGDLLVNVNLIFKVVKSQIQSQVQGQMSNPKSKVKTKVNTKVKSKVGPKLDFFAEFQKIELEVDFSGN